MDGCRACRDRINLHNVPRDIADALRDELMHLENEAKKFGGAVVNMSNELRLRSDSIDQLPADANVIDLITDVYPRLATLTLGYGEPFKFSSVFGGAHRITPLTVIRKLESNDLTKNDINSQLEI
jgi:hypothetical protein